MKILSSEKSNTMLGTTIWHVQPDHIGHAFFVVISVPMGCPPEEGWHGTMSTDGNYTAGTINQMLYFLSMEGAPPNVSVAIGYPFDQKMSPLMARNRELTPKAWPEWDESYAGVHQQKTPESGHADEFLAFLDKELKPVVEAEFSVNPDHWSLFGHSLGGLFSTYVLLTSPFSFKRYLASGASYWWRGGEIFALAEDFALKSEEINARIYIAVGDPELAPFVARRLESQKDNPIYKRYLDVMNWEPDMIGDSKRMAEILDQRSGVTAKFDVLQGESHSSEIGPALSRGIRWLYGVS